VLAGFRRVSGEGFVGFEMLVALDGETELAANFTEFVEADEADLWSAHSEVAEAVGDVVVAGFVMEDLRLAVGFELLELGLSEEPLK
jgi:hypothetical protein